MRWHWFKTNILGELPVFGGMFKCETLSAKLQHTGKMACELAGGSAGMILLMLNKPMPMMGEDSSSESATYYAEMTGAMALGMMTGAVTFNVARSFSKGAYQFFKNRINQHEHRLPGANSEEALLTGTPLSAAPSYGVNA